MDLPVEYTEKKKAAIEKAITKLADNSSEKELIGPGDSNERMWVALKDSTLGKRVLAQDAEYKQYPSVYKDGEEYIIFSQQK